MRADFIGVDPGQVHTGVVGFTIDSETRACLHWYDLIDGLDVDATIRTVHRALSPFVFVENYRPRSHFKGDAELQHYVLQLKHALHPYVKLIDNTGVKQVVTKQMLEAFGVWKFNTYSHHQDLRSAARIGLYGALKDEQLNKMLYHSLLDHFALGTP